MGFCFNRQLRMLHTMQDTAAKSNKRKKSNQIRVIRNPVISRKASHKKLSAEDNRFLKSIGLKIRK